MWVRLRDPSAADDRGSTHEMNANHESEGHSDHLLSLQHLAKSIRYLGTWFHAQTNLSTRTEVPSFH